MANTVDILYFDVSLNRHIASLDVDTGVIFDISAPLSPYFNNVYAAKRADGTYILPEFRSGAMVLNILSADRTTWTLVSIAGSAGLNTVDPMNTFWVPAFESAPARLWCWMDPATNFIGLPMQSNHIDDGDNVIVQALGHAVAFDDSTTHVQAPHVVHDEFNSTIYALGTTESQYIYKFDATNAVMTEFYNANDAGTTDFDITGPAYNVQSQMIYAYGLAPHASRIYVIPWLTEGGLPTIYDFVLPFNPDFDAMGDVCGRYYVLLDGTRRLFRFNLDKKERDLLNLTFLNDGQGPWLVQGSSSGLAPQAFPELRRRSAAFM